MILPKKIIVIIPAFNESKTIENVVRSSLKSAYKVIVIDDGSSDNTANLAKKAGAIVLRHGNNLGYDVSICNGFKKALEESGQIFITLDADGQHNAGDIKSFASYIADGKAEVVIGERPGYHHLMEKLFAFYTKYRCGINDPLCGLKAYSSRVYETFGHFDTLNSIGTQLAIESAIKGFKILNVKISVQERIDTSRFYSKHIQANLKILRALFNVICYI